MKILVVTLLSLILMSFIAITPPAEPILSGVYRWADFPVKTSADREFRKIFEGSSSHLSLLSIHATTQLPGAEPSNAHANDDSEELVIIKEGIAHINLNGQIKELGPNGILSLQPNQMHSIANAGTTPLTYYVFRFKSNAPKNLQRGISSGGTMAIHADTLTFTPSAKGGGMPYFDRPTTMFERLEMHMTQLNNPGPSHAPHQHAETEVILVLSGNTEMTIDGLNYTAQPGDFYFMESGTLHGIHNVSDKPCSYLAFKWK